LILWIVYWVKIAGYSRQLESFPMPSATPYFPQGN
jgi:hypothetical protein